MENTDTFNKIVFWGPQSSGKTWLFRSFIKKVQLINDSLVKQGCSIRVEETEESNGPWKLTPNVDDLQTLGTQDITQVYYRIIRDANYPSSSSPLQQRVNKHINEIWVIDSPGGWFQKDNQASTSDADKKTGSIKETIQGAQYLILALDTGNTIEGAASFLDDLKQLIKWVEGTERKQIAACITKTDALGKHLVIPLYNRDETALKSLLTRSFGPTYASQIEDSLATLRRVHTVKLFATSAAGYYENNGEKIVNLNIDRTALANVAAWRPEEVEKPFFWLFDVINQKRIEYLDPAGKLFRFLMRDSTILNARKNAYLSYDQLLRIAQTQPGK